MKASELVKKLQDKIDKFGDLDVTLYTDHGQTQCCAYSVDVQDQYTDEWVEEGDVVTQVFELYGE
jgi:hypothetical protein